MGYFNGNCNRLTNKLLAYIFFQVRCSIIKGDHWDAVVVVAFYVMVMVISVCSLFSPTPTQADISCQQFLDAVHKDNNSVNRILLLMCWEEQAKLKNETALIGLAYIYADQDSLESKEKALAYFKSYQTIKNNVKPEHVIYFQKVKKDIEYLKEVKF